MLVAFPPLARLCRLAPLLLVLGCSQAAAVPPAPSAPPGDLLAIGDSIRIGWARYLKCEQPADNCGDTRNGVRSIERWTGGRHWRTVVLNFGLHDIHHNVPLDEYCRNLAEIIHHIHADRIYFCTTTPGRENNWLGRTPENVEKYNCAARWVMAREHVQIIDLYTLADQHREWWRPDVHYTDQGYAGLANYVKRAIGL